MTFTLAMWCLFLAGFVSTAASTYGWAGRGVIVSLAAGLVAGEAFAFFAAFLATHPPMAETYLQDPLFVVAAGIFWTLTWWVGAGFGSPVGFTLRRIKQSKIRNVVSKCTS
jgi:hypothetical protein